MPRLLCFATCLVLAALSLPSAAAPPNIVLILSDDQGWTDYGFMGHEHIRTPNIDRLARQSLTFTRGYVPDSLCRPSLATIISGLYPHQHRIVGNDPPLPEKLAGQPKAVAAKDPRYLEQRRIYIEHLDRVPKLPALLAKQGYLSFQSGKWWEGDFRRGGFTHGMTHGDMQRGGRHGDAGLTIGRQGLQPIFDFITESRQQQKPFFVWYAPIMPHTPHTPPERLLAHYRERAGDLASAKYWAMCEWFDETVGDLLGHLDKQGVADNTIVVYVTDNGWQQLPGQEGGGSGGPRAKRSQYDLGVRTPILVRWPGRVTPKLDREHFASSIDLVPTLLAAVGQPATPEMPGVNLLDADAVSRRTTMYGEIFEHDIQHMTDPVPSLRFRWVIDGPWKLIVPHPARVPNAPVELYRILDDPHERTNLAPQHADVVASLRTKLDAWWPAK